MYILRIKHTAQDGFSWFQNVQTFRHKKDAEKYRRMHYKNTASKLQIIPIRHYNKMMRAEMARAEMAHAENESKE
jgi:hypothetical protein